MEQFIQNFIAWSYALKDHFFGNKESTEEVFIYANDEVLDEIGQEHNLGSHNDFLNAVFLNCNQRKAFFEYAMETVVRDKYSVNRLTTKQKILLNGSLLEFASLLTESFNVTGTQDGDAIWEKCYFLNYVVLVMYIANNVQDSRGNGIGKEITKIIKDRLNEDGNYHSIPSIFDALNEYDDRFKNETFTQWRYIGYVKYQLFFSNRQIENLKSALYKCNTDFDDMSYEEKIDRLIRFADDNWQEILKKSLDQNTHRRRIESIIDDFDADEYREGHQTANLIEEGKFALALLLENVDNKLVLLSNRKIHIDTSYKGTHYSYSGEEYDKLDKEYYDEHVLVNGSDKVTIKQYKIDNGHISMRSINGQNPKYIVFEKKYGYGNEIMYYIQTTSPTSGKDCFVAIKRQYADDVIQKNELLSNSNLQYLPLPTDYLSQLLGQGWSLYHTDSIVATETNTSEALTANKIVRVNGIRPPKQNVHLINALPCYEFPYPIKECLNEIKVYINANGQNLDRDTDFRILHNDRKLIIDILNNDFDIDDQPTRIDINIEHGDLSLSENDRSFMVSSQNVEYQDSQLFTYDKWGEYIEIPNNNQYLSGTNIEGQDHIEIHQPVNIACLEEINGISDDYYFINLLAAMCFMNPNREISRQGLEKCIRYACTHMMVDLASEYKFISKVKYLLINNGFINPRYGNTTGYQVVPPTFIKVPYFSNNDALFMLIGCYTRRFMSDLLNYCSINSVMVYKRNNGNEILKSPSQKLLPPILLINSNFDIEQFRQSTNHSFEYTGKRDYAKELLAFSATVEDFSGTLQEEFIGALRMTPPSENGFPRIRLSNTEHIKSFVEKSEGVFMNSFVKNNVWKELYCKSNKGKPLFILTSESETGYRSILHLYVPCGNNMHLPYIVQRALFVLNLGLPRYEETFICNNDVTNIKNMYTMMKIYDIYNANREEVSAMLNGLFAMNGTSVIKSCNENYQYAYIEHWIKNHIFGNENLFILRRRYDDKAMAFVYHNNIYIKKGGKFRQVEGEINSIISVIITSEQPHNIEFNYTGTTLECPYTNEYTLKSTLKILK